MKFCFSAVCGLALFSCHPANNKTAQEIIQEDYDTIYVNADVTEIRLADAMKMALESNLDAKIAQQDYVVSMSDAELQKLNSLPSIVARSDYITRSNPGAASSFSVLTGARSLEPSISTDQSRFTALLEMNWNVLDSAINIYRSKSAVDQAIIAQERYRKVRQNILMDLYSVYWRLAALQVAAPSLDEALTDSDDKLKALEAVEKSGDLSFETIDNIRRQIIPKRKRLLDVQRERELAELQLKALLSIPPQKDIRLVFDESELEHFALDLEKADFNQVVMEALMERPEIREELLNLKISERNINIEVLQTFPGLDIILGANYDENSFLEESTWLNLTAGVAQSITKLLTLPARRDKAEKQLEFTNIKRKALVAAVVSQVHIAKIIYNKSRQAMKEEQRAFGLSDAYIGRNAMLRESGLVSGMDAVNNRLQFEVDKVDYYTKLAEVHAAQARLMNSIGQDLEGFSGLLVHNEEMSEADQVDE